MATEKTSKADIPTSDFIEDVGAFLVGKDANEVISGLQKRHSQLTLLHAELASRKQRLLTKLPEIEKALAMVKKLLAEDGEPMSLDFELSPHVYSVAKIQGVKTVNLWLGANVMVEYELQEAHALLEGNVATVKANLATVNGDIDMIKESTTTTEVSIARVHNHDVEMKKKLKAQAEA